MKNFNRETVKINQIEMTAQKMWYQNGIEIWYH